MKKSKRILIAVITAVTVLCVLLSFTACTDGSSSSSSETAQDVAGDATIVTTTDRMIVYTVDMRITAKDVAAAQNAAAAKVTEYGGYVKTMYSNSSGYTSISYSVPTVSLDAFVADLKTGGEVNNMSIASEDITETYTTVAARKSALETQKAALTEMLKRTNLTTAEELQINNELYNVSAQIDAYSTQLGTLKKQSDYSTVNVTYYEEGIYQEPNFWDKLGNVFMGSGASLGKVFGWILIAIVAILPYFAVVACAFGIYVLIKYIVCKSKKKPFTLFQNCKNRRAESKARRAYYQQRLNSLNGVAQKASPTPSVAANAQNVNQAEVKTEEKPTEEKPTEEKPTEENKDDGNK